MEHDISDYHVSLSTVVGSSTMLPVTRLLAADLQTNPYLTIGDFFKNLSDSDLQALIEVVDEGETNAHFSELLLVSQMLATAEGLGAKFENLDIVTQRVNAFCMYVAIESLHRKGLVKVHHQNMSFGDDMKSKIVVERID